MTNYNHIDQIKGMLKAVIAANPDHKTDDRQAGRQDVAEYVLAAITLLDSGLVDTLGFDRFIEPVDPPTYTVQVDGKYWFIAEPAEVGTVTMGDRVDVQGRHTGAHWQGTVTSWMSADDYVQTENEDLPQLKVLQILAE